MTLVPLYLILLLPSIEFSVEFLRFLLESVLGDSNAFAGNISLAFDGFLFFSSSSSVVFF